MSKHSDQTNEHTQTLQPFMQLPISCSQYDSDSAFKSANLTMLSIRRPISWGHSDMFRFFDKYSDIPD